MDSQMTRALTADNPWLAGEAQSQALSPWLSRFLPKGYRPRQLELNAAMLEQTARATLVVGPRQAGKSTLIWKTLADAGGPVVYLNCEDPSIRQGLVSPATFLADLDTIDPAKHPLFFEEVQALDEAGLFLKGLVDRRCGRPIVATGSSAFDLESKTRESLAGRAQRHLLLPFSVREQGLHLRSRGAIRQQQLRDIVTTSAVWGGYPRVVASKAPEQELAELVEAFIVRDVSDRFRIRRTAAFRKILQLAASQIGNLVNFSEWAALAGISNDTVLEHCQLLENAHIIRLVRPFVGGKRAEITSAPKIFFIDNGVRNQIYGGFHAITDRADRGALFENLVFSELRKTLNPLLDSIRYWRSKSGAEVDFVVEHQGRILALEVKAGDVRGKLSRAARSFIDAYRPEVFAVVNRETYSPQALDSTQVVFWPFEELTDRLETWLATG